MRRHFRKRGRTAGGLPHAVLSVLAPAALVVLAACGGGESPVSGNGPGGIDVPAAFQSTSTSSMIATAARTAGVRVAAYEGSAGASEALDAFREAAAAAGWKRLYEGRQVSALGGQLAGTAFEKGDRVLLVAVNQRGEGVRVTVVQGRRSVLRTSSGGDADQARPREQADAAEHEPPTSDEEGEDPPDIPRYPGSVRTSYGEAQSDEGRLTEVEYLAEASCEEIIDHFEEALPEAGWSIAGTRRSGGEHVLAARKSASTAVGIRCRPSDAYQDYREIEVTRGEGG